jgi:hypothetical protein
VLFRGRVSALDVCLNEAGRAPDARIVLVGPPGESGTKSVGDDGRYSGIYCFALTP